MKKCRSAADEYTREDAAAYGISDFGPSLTVQAEEEACNINNIMKKYHATGLLPQLQQRQPVYGDFSKAADFQESMNLVAHAQSQFAALSAEVRAKFLNNPAKMLEYVEEAKKDPAKAKELVKLGLAHEVPAPKEDPQLTALKTIAENTKQRRASAASKPQGDPE